jgi:hypothetical protein
MVNRLGSVDDADLKRSTWRSIAAFQRLLGHAGTLRDHDDYVASRVPSSHSSLINAGVPKADLTPHHARLGYRSLGEIHLYEKQPG